MDITPTEPCPLGANGAPSKHWRRIASPLEANLLVLHSPDGSVAIATFDLLYVGPVITKLIRKRMAEFLPPERLWLSASHTHTAPAVDPGKPRLGEPDPDYLSRIAESVAAGLINMLDGEDSVPVVDRVGTGLASNSINRRRPGRLRFQDGRVMRGGIAMGPNPVGPTDETIRRLDWVDMHGRTRAILWNYSCHPTSSPDRLAVSPDFPGNVRSLLRGGDDIPVFFFQGFCGDTKPTSIARFRDMPVRRLLMGPRFRLFTPQEHHAWAESLATAVAGIQMRPTAPQATQVSGRRAVLRSDNFVSDSTVDSVVFQQIQIGEMTLAGVSAEPVVDYIAGLPITAGEQAWPVGYLDDVFGYAPTARQLAQGGYEAGGFCSHLNCGSVNPKLESSMRRGFNAAAASSSGSS